MTYFHLVASQAQAGGLAALFLDAPAKKSTVLIVLGALALFSLVLLFWAMSPKRRRSHRSHHHHHRHHEPSAQEPEHGSGRRKRRQRREHRPMNPTRAETGGLPPARDQKPPAL